MLDQHEGLVSFPVESERDWSGLEWSRELKRNGVLVCNDARDFLLSPSFRTTKGYHNLVIAKGEHFRDKERTTPQLRAFASEHKLNNARAEVALLFHEHLFQFREMNLWTLVAMEPIQNTNGGVLFVTGLTDCGPWLNIWKDNPDYRWGKHTGFVFSSLALARSFGHFDHNHPH